MTDIGAAREAATVRRYTEAEPEPSENTQPACVCPRYRSRKPELRPTTTDLQQRISLALSVLSHCTADPHVQTAMGVLRGEVQL